jgi:hypothetical protein
MQTIGASWTEKGSLVAKSDKVEKIMGGILAVWSDEQRHFS